MPLNTQCSHANMLGGLCSLWEGHDGPHHCTRKGERCDYFFFPANHPQDWMKDSALVRCGRYKGHDGHHWPVPVGLDVPPRAATVPPGCCTLPFGHLGGCVFQSANAEKVQPAKDSQEERQRMKEVLLMNRLDRIVMLLERLVTK